MEVQLQHERAETARAVAELRRVHSVEAAAAREALQEAEAREARLTAEVARAQAQLEEEAASNKQLRAYIGEKARSVLTEGGSRDGGACDQQPASAAATAASGVAASKVVD